jgi:hypothetical protein
VSESVLSALIAGVPATVTAAAALIVSLKNGRKLEVVHRTTNSRLDQLLELTRTQAHAEGVLEEKKRGEHLAP